MRIESVSVWLYVLAARVRLTTMVLAQSINSCECYAEERRKDPMNIFK